MKAGPGATAGSGAPDPEDEEENTGPLGFLDRLLDEERDSNLHFGDVRFWKYMEHIDTSRVYSLKSLEYRMLKMMFFEAIFYMLFLFALTGYITHLRSGDPYESRNQQLDYWAGCKRTRNGGRSCEIDHIHDLASLTSWLREGFTPKAFTFRDEYPSLVTSPSIFRLQAGTVHWSPRYVGDTKTNVLIGSIRLRQLRVQYNKECKIFAELQDIHSDCFPPFSDAVQSKLSWAPTWTPAYLKPYYKWHPANQTEQEVMHGYQASYPGDGFVMDLPLNLTGAQMRLLELEGWKWLDERTRAFIIELTTLNPNTNVFVRSRMLFEFPATGGLVVRQEAHVLRTLQISLSLMGADDLGGTFVYCILTSALHCVLLMYVAYLIRKNGLAYFSYLWSSVDLIILSLFFLYVCVVVDIYAVAAWEPKFQPESIVDTEAFFPIGRLAMRVETANSIMAALTLMSWLKMLKYFSLIGPFHPFVRVVERCIVNLLQFAGIVLIVLFGFAVALHVAYGDENNLFATLRGSLVAVMVAPAGGVGLDPVFEKGDFLGPVLVFTYIIIVFFLLLNTFMAICVDTYTVSTFQISECLASKNSPQSNPTAVFLWTYFSALKGVKLVGKETQDEMGDTMEQEIQLSSLPEHLQLRYSQTKRRMEQILNSAEGEIKAKEAEQLRKQGLLRDSELEGQRSAAGEALALEDEPRGGGAEQPAALALEDKPGAPRPPPPPSNAEPPPPEEEPSTVMVKRVQLQRMLDDDAVLREVCGASRAVEVIRRFRVDQGGIDPYEAVAELQKSVAEKLQELEENGLDLSFDEMETLKQVSTELHSALTESQKEWRAELLTVTQMASLLHVALVGLTRRLEAVQLNHKKLAQRAGFR